MRVNGAVVIPKGYMFVIGGDLDLFYFYLLNREELEDQKEVFTDRFRFGNLTLPLS